MVRNIFSKWSLLILCFLPLVVHGQIVNRHVVIANGGAYSNPNDFVTIKIYNPETQVTTDLATIFTQSVQGLEVHDGFGFVAAQDSLVKIDIESGERVAAIGLSGVNKFGFYNDRLIVTRQYPVTAGFVQIRNLSDLSLIKTFDEISDEAYDVFVAGDSAYISVTGGWAATVGKLAVLDMKSEIFVREINLGSEAAGISNIFIEGNDLYFVCKTPYMASSGAVLKYNLNTGSVVFSSFQHLIGKAAGLKNGKLYLMIDGNIGSINISTMEITDFSLVADNYPNLDITACTLDVVNEQLYVSFSYWIAPNGTGKIFDLNGNETGNYEVGISSEYLAVNYLDINALGEITESNKPNLVYPNPCGDKIFLASDCLNQMRFSVFDVSGKEVLSSNKTNDFKTAIDVSMLKPGIYFLKVFDDNQLFTTKFIKE